MEIRISLNEYADIPFIKKLLSQIKGISEIELIKDNEVISDKENEEINQFCRGAADFRCSIGTGLLHRVQCRQGAGTEGGSMDAERCLA